MIQENPSPEQDLQGTEMTAYINYLQAGDIIPGWELINPDNTSIGLIHFEHKKADTIEDNNLKEHLIRVRSRKNNLVFNADIGSPSSFVHEKSTTLPESSMKSARRIKLENNDEANRMIC